MTSTRTAGSPTRRILASTCKGVAQLQRGHANLSQLNQARAILHPLGGWLHSAGLIELKFFAQRTIELFGKFVFGFGLALGTFVPFGSAAAFTTVYEFKGGADGGNPFAGLIIGASGTLYGTTYFGGGSGGTACYNYGCGTVFGVAQDGTESVLHAFCSKKRCGDGSNPDANLIADASGNLYGTTSGGGSYRTKACHQLRGCGTVFKLTPHGKETVLYVFKGYEYGDGAGPGGGLIVDAAGNFYGTTAEGGKNACYRSEGCGTVFKLAPDGTETVLYSFCSQANCTDGRNPVASLIMDGSGNLYGTTFGGGSNNAGSIFKLAPDGTESVLYSFCSQANCADGQYPRASLITDASGNLYGTTNAGGGQANCNCGTVFKLAPDGTENVLHAFTGGSDGATPSDGAGLVEDAAGDFYGATFMGGAPCDCGTIFKIAPDGTETVLYSFSGGSDGAFPDGGLASDTAGNLYGTASGGGIASCSINGGCGTVFELQE